MKVLFLIFAVSAAFVIQSRMSIFGIPPAFILILPYYIGLKRNAMKGMLAGTITGMIVDSLSGNILGPHLLGKGMVGFLSSLLSGSLFRWTPLLGMTGIFILTMWDGLTVFSIKTLFNIQSIPASRLITTILLQGILNSMVGIFLRPENAE